MKKGIQFMVIICSFSMSSCIKFLYPLTEDKNQIVFQSGLLGHWQEKDGTQYLIDSVDEKHYRVVMIDKKTPPVKFSDSNYFSMILVNVHGTYFLDCTPDIQQPAFYQFGEQASDFLLPVHSILKLNTISKTAIEIASINTTEVKKLIDQKKLAVHYNTTGRDGVLLTAKPEQIQRQLTELQKFPSAWEKETFRRF